MSWHLDSNQRLVLKQALTASTFQKFVESALGDNNIIVTDIAGLPDAGLSLVSALASFVSRRPIAIITATAERATEIYDDLEHFGHPAAYHFPKWEILPYEHEEPVVEILAKSLAVYECLLDLRATPPEPRPLKFELDFDKLERQTVAPIVVTSIEAALQRAFPLDVFAELCLSVEWGEQLDLERLTERLVNAGYEREPMVEGRGEFSIRGGIVDIFPVSFDDPIRLDLFGDEIESIRWFDLDTQRSFKKRDIPEQMRVPPAAINRLLCESAAAGKALALLPELLPDNALLILDDPDAFPGLAEEFSALVDRQYQSAQEEIENDPPSSANPQSAISNPQSKYAALAEFDAAIADRRRALHSRLSIERPGAKVIRFSATSFAGLEPSLDTYMKLISGKQREDFFSVVICDNDGQAMRLDELMREYEIGAVQVLEAERFSKQVQRRDPLTGYSDVVLSVGTLHNGMIWPEARLLLVTDREMFGRYKRRQVFRKVYKGAPIQAVTDIQRGDYIVHVDHGIGRFLGIRQQPLDGRAIDLIELEYAEGNKLLVPLENIASVQKFTASEHDARPKLDKLGSTRWLKRKNKSKADIEKMARELLALYARREAAQGKAYGPDTLWQREFEASFIYNETPDQLEAIAQVKEDLKSDKPTDRLICGDVGYGKTEVAIRAAFKVIQEGRQVAVLCPTTILAQQHWKTFSERFAEYPVEIEMLSRFRTPKQQQEILKRLRLDEINLVIGTHRILSKDIEFCNLGLLVVDEEQRFGVRHKERIKELRASIDVITLTATPIPRTLYMALSGLRDMSLIQTAPANRHPIRTRIIHFKEEMIREAILRELNRGGQIFFVHNRVHNIEEVANRIREIVPQARLVIGHGQMDNRTLENVMLDFIAGDFDILLSTTIIENGLDIPNVNTIIINRADAFGLAQLYQLRGRVGRDVRRAYAYLIVPEGQPISETATRRLNAIEEFTELGHGFDIAMRDLQIRGTGNILGSEQHGVMMQIGFELYCDLLGRAVKELRGDEIEDDRLVEVKWKCDVYVPHDYMPIESQRVSVYKRLATIRSVRALDDVIDELRDRYGPIPAPLDNLLNITRLRILGGRAGLDRVQNTPNGFRIFPLTDVVEYAARVGAAQKQEPALESFAIQDEDSIAIHLPKLTPEEKLPLAAQILTALADSGSRV